MSEELGDLAQSARSNELGSAKGTLIFVGFLTVAVNAFMFANATNEVREVGVAPADFDYVLGMVRLIYGSAILMGLALAFCGFFVRRWPVPMTIAGLALYIIGTGGFAFLDPSSLMRGIIVKVIIVIVLCKAVKTAFAYQQDRAAGLI